MSGDGHNDGDGRDRMKYRLALSRGEPMRINDNERLSRIMTQVNRDGNDATAFVRRHRKVVAKYLLDKMFQKELAETPEL